MRTVIWQFAGDDIEEELLAQLEGLRSGIDVNYLSSLITLSEVDALFARIDLIIHTKQFPLPNPEWPAIPWPPF